MQYYFVRIITWLPVVTYNLHGFIKNTFYDCAYNFFMNLIKARVASVRCVGTYIRTQALLCDYNRPQGRIQAFNLSIKIKPEVQGYKTKKTMKKVSRQKFHQNLSCFGLITTTYAKKIKHYNTYKNTKIITLII